MTAVNTVLNAATLVFLGVLVYGWLREFRSSESYRAKHLERREEELDVALLTVLRLRQLGVPVVASERANQDSDSAEDCGDVVAHESLLSGVGS